MVERAWLLSTAAANPVEGGVSSPSTPPTEATKESEPEMDMTVIEAMENALQMLNSFGVTGGDIVDDLQLAITRLRTKHPKVATEVL